tara:strand:+ start:265 stop:588 length:324 start_codon:yes stop_codon:yes gene_type:complete
MSAFTKRMVNHGIRDEVSELHSEIQKELENRVNIAIDDHKAIVAASTFESTDAEADEVDEALSPGDLEQRPGESREKFAFRKHAALKIAGRNRAPTGLMPGHTVAQH